MIALCLGVFAATPVCFPAKTPSHKASGRRRTILLRFPATSLVTGTLSLIVKIESLIEIKKAFLERDRKSSRVRLFPDC